MSNANHLNIMETASLAASFLELQTKRQVHPITCTRTGLTVAALTVERIAGHVPYLSQWKHTQALHPLFSLEVVPLLNFSRSVWNHFCNLTPEEAGNDSLTTKQELLLRIAALAMLHHLSDVEQTVVWIPSLADVSNHWTSLLALSYWKNYLESKRFRFPNLRISRHNKGIDLGSYIKDCWDVKKEYENKVRESVELEKLKSAEAALKVLRDDLAGKAPRSKKLLWRWFLANIPSRYAQATETWMWELFDAETSDEIGRFTLADIDLFEEIVLAEIELGSTISHTFLDRLSQKRELLATKLQTFEVMIPNSIALGVADGSITEDEPKQENFATKVKWMIAHAKWRLAFTDMKKLHDTVLKNQNTITVDQKYIPDISEYLGGEDRADESDATELFDRLNKRNPRDE